MGPQHTVRGWHLPHGGSSPNPPVLELQISGIRSLSPIFASSLTGGAQACPEPSRTHNLLLSQAARPGLVALSHWGWGLLRLPGPRTRLGVTQQLIYQSTLAREHVVGSTGSGFKPGPACHYQGTLGRSLHCFEPISSSEKGAGGHMCSVNSVPAQARGGAWGQWLRPNPNPQNYSGWE